MKKEWLLAWWAGGCRGGLDYGHAHNVQLYVIVAHTLNTHP